MIISSKKFFGDKPGVPFMDNAQPEAPKEQGYLERVGSASMERGKNIVEDIKRPAQLASEGASPFKVAGAVAEAGLRTAGNAAGLLLEPVVQAVSPAIDPVVEKVASLPGVKGGVEAVSSFAQKHPDAFKDLSAILDIVGVLGGGSAVKAGKTAGTKLLSEAGEFVSKAGSKVDDVVGGVVKDVESATSKVIGKVKPSTDILEAITPRATELTPTEYGDLLRKGKITPKTATQEAKYVLSEAEKATAQKYSHLLNTGDPVRNMDNVLKDIVTKDEAVGKYLETKTTEIWSKARFKKSLLKELEAVDDVMIPEARLAKAKQNLVSQFVDSLPKKATLKDLWEARKNFDQTIERELRAFSGSPTLKKEMAKSLRNAVQDFISDSTGEAVYKDAMKDMRELFNISDILETKAMKEKGLSGLRAWMKANPQQTKAAKLFLGILGAGTAGAVITN